MTIAYNCLVDYWRSSARDSADLPDEQVLAAPQEDEENGWKAQEIVTAMTRISADESALLSMFYGEKCTVATIAARLGITESAAKVRLFRARQALRKEVEALYGKGRKKHMKQWTDEELERSLEAALSVEPEAAPPPGFTGDVWRRIDAWGGRTRRWIGASQHSGTAAGEAHAERGTAGRAAGCSCTCGRLHRGVPVPLLCCCGTFSAGRPAFFNSPSGQISRRHVDC